MALSASSLTMFISLRLSSTRSCTSCLILMVIPPIEAAANRDS